jgi:hypothetical protein
VKQERENVLEKKIIGSEKHLPEETKKLISEKVKKYYSNNKSPFYWKKHTEENKKIMSEKKKGLMVGEKNPFYGNRHTEEIKNDIRYATGHNS